jgi:hypothetical protein
MSDGCFIVCILSPVWFWQVGVSYACIFYSTLAVSACVRSIFLEPCLDENQAISLPKIGKIVEHEPNEIGIHFKCESHFAKFSQLRAFFSAILAPHFPSEHDMILCSQMFQSNPSTTSLSYFSCMLTILTIILVWSIFTPTIYFIYVTIITVNSISLTCKREVVFLWISEICLCIWGVYSNLFKGKFVLKESVIWLTIENIW